MSTPEPVLTPDNPDFWRLRYQTNTTAWDLNQGAPAFQALLKDNDPNPLVPGNSLVIGCGKGHDAALFAEYGHHVTAIDFAPEAITDATSRYGALPFAQRLRFQEADLFDLPTTMYQHFDTVIEHACFCAISPKDRQKYVNAVSQCLKPGGLLVGIFWVHDQWGGPPYSTNPDELKTLFSPQFDLAYLKPTPHSIPSRALEEWLGLFKRL